jgi:uncharacterized membrane protein
MKNITETGVVMQTGIVSPIPVQARTVFVARGNEPFWAFEQFATGAKFSRPGQLAIEETYYTSTESYSGASILVSASPISTGNTLNIVLTPGVCSDGMSDNVYNHIVKLITPSEVFNGCSQF